MTTSQVEIPEQDEERVYCHRRNCPGSTGLRCYQTGVPICMQCAVRTPVGYISKDAQKERQAIYFNIHNTDYVLVALVGFFGTLFIGFPAVFILSGFGFFALFIMAMVGSGVGGVIGELTFRAIQRRRGRYTQQILMGAMISANFLIIFPLLLTLDIYGLLIGGFFAVTSIGSAVARIRVAL